MWSLGHTAVFCVATDDNDVEGAQRCGKESRKEAWRLQSLPWLWLLPLSDVNMGINDAHCS